MKAPYSPLQAKPSYINELLRASHLGVAYGILFVFWSLLFTLTKPFLRLLFLPWGFSPVGREFLMGFWFQTGVLIPYVVRRKGTAFLGSMVAALVQMPLVPWGFSTLLSGMVQGLASEFVFFVTRYKNYRLPVLLLAGSLPAFTSFFYEYIPFSYGKYAMKVQIAMLFARLVSGLLLGGYFPYKIAQSLQKTGVLPQIFDQTAPSGQIVSCTSSSSSSSFEEKKEHSSQQSRPL